MSSSVWSWVAWAPRVRVQERVDFLVRGPAWKAINLKMDDASITQIDYTVYICKWKIIHALKTNGTSVTRTQD